MAADRKPPKREPDPDMGPLQDQSLIWRLSLWAGAATVALAAAILMTLTDGGSQRLQMALSLSETPVKPITQADFTPPAVVSEAQRRETARLETQVRELAADRERLSARIASLEQNLADVTGSIKRDLALVTATTPPTPPAVPKPAPAIVAPATVAAPAAAPTVAPERIESAAKTDVRPKSETRVESGSDIRAAEKSDGKPETKNVTKVEQRTASNAADKPQANPESKPENKSEAKSEAKIEGKAEDKPDTKMATVPASLPVIRPLVAPPAVVPPPMPQPRAGEVDTRQALAALQEGDPDAEEPLMAPPLDPPVRLPSRPIVSVPVGKQLAIDLGGARSMEILQARWIAVKANFGPFLNGMRPLAVHDRRRGVIPYRLIVGPLPNGAAAAEICAHFTASHVSCRTTKFAGEQLIVQ